MVLRKDTDQRHLISLVLHMSGNEKTLEVSTDFPESSDFGGNGRIIKEVVKHVRWENGFRDDETLAVEVKSTYGKRGRESEIKHATMNRIDIKVAKVNSDTSENGYYCEKCKLKYRYKHNFEAHIMKNHESGNKLSVDESIKKSNDNAEYLERRSIETKQKLYCETCNKYFKTRRCVRDHIKLVHLGIKKHACDICERRFFEKSHMIYHRRIHTDERPFVCQVCGKGLTTFDILKKHLRSHSSERPFSCKICHKAFKFLHHLQTHNVVHTKEKNCICEVCGKRFGKIGDLKKHRVIHSGLKPYSCPLCDSTFNQRRYLKQHLRGKHCLDSSEACKIVGNIAVHDSEQTDRDKHRQPIPVNKTVDASNVLQNTDVSTNETDVPLQALESV